MTASPLEHPHTDKQWPLVLGALSAILVFFLFTRPVVDADLWWHLRAGKDMWEQKHILLTDTFSYTRAGQSWVNAFWIAELLFYLLYRIGGYILISGFVAFIGAITFYLVYRRLSGNPILNSFIIVLAALTAAPIWGPRPQILSFLFVALLDLWLSRKQPSWLMLPFFALWANIHGGWIWGFLLLFAHIAGLIVQSFFTPQDGILRRKEALHLLGWTAGAAIAIGLNPNGFVLWHLPFQQVTVSMQIQEWLSPDFHRPDFHPILWMLFFLILSGPFAKKPLDWPQIFKVLGFAYLTFVAQRNIALYAMTAAPLLSQWIGAAVESLQWKATRPERSLDARLKSSINAALIILSSLAVLGNLFLTAQPARVDENYPVAAVEWVRTNQPQGRMFNSYNWGGYLTWNLPSHEVFIDGRADLYGSDLLQQWHDVVNANENAQEILADWDVSWVFLEPNWPVVTLLRQNDWQVLYNDESAIILGRP